MSFDSESLRPVLVLIQSLWLPLFGSTGKGAIKALLSPEFAKQKKVPKVTTEEEAVALLHSIIPLFVPSLPSFSALRPRLRGPLAA